MIRLRTVKLVIFGEIPAAAERFKIYDNYQGSLFL